jgi:tetratricopeptide (TPR) repeat protein
MRKTILVLVALLVSALQVPVRAQSGTADIGAAGWQALQDNDGETAWRLFVKALALRPDDAVLHLGAGAAAHMLGVDDDASQALRQALAIDPALTIASKLLGEIAYKQGDIDAAIDAYEQALVHAPDSLELATRLDRLTAEATRRAAANRFSVTMAGSRDDALAAHATKALNTAYWRVAKLVGAFPAETIAIELNTTRPFRDIAAMPTWNNTRFDGTIAINAGGATSDLDAFDRVLMHELTHAMLASWAPTGVPAWFHEGLAQLVEPADVALAERRLKASGALPWTALDGSLHRESADAQTHYDISLLIVRALLDRIGGKSTALLDELADGHTLDGALAQFGFTYADLQADVAHCLR